MSVVRNQKLINSLSFFFRFPIFLISLVLNEGAYQFFPTHPTYTGLIRQMGDSDSYVVSFDPEITDILLSQCISGKGYVAYKADSTAGTQPSNYYSCVLHYTEQDLSSPAVGLSAYSSISNFWFHINGEDGFASAYSTSVDLLISPTGDLANPNPTGSCGQQTICGKTGCAKPDTPFIISGSHFNRASLSILATVTYANGNHWLVSIESNNTAQATCTNPSPTGSTSSQQPGNSLYLRNILQLNATGIIPAMSGFDQFNLYYVLVISRGNSVFLTAATIGMDQNGKPLGQAGVVWETDITRWRITSVQVDGNLEGGSFGKVFCMMYNASGHFLITVNIETGKFIGSEYFIESPDTRIAYGLSAMAPNSFGFLDSSHEPAVQLLTYSYFTRDRLNSTQNVSGQLKSLSWDPTASIGLRSSPLFMRDAASVQPGKTFVSLESRFTTIPQAQSIFPSFAHVVGGTVVTVRGGPFVDSASLSCRWMVDVSACYWKGTQTYNEACTWISRRDANLAVYISSEVMLCISPSVSRNTIAQLSVSLNGIVWSGENQQFVFFTTGNNMGQHHISGSAKGYSILIVSGLNLQFLSWNELVLPQSRCEFGDFKDPSTYNYDKSMVFNPDTCFNISLQSRQEELCSFTCKTPTIPHIYCLTGARCPLDGVNDTSKCNHFCTTFVSACPPPTSPLVDSVGKCKATIKTYVEVPLRLVFAGDRLDYGFFQYTSDFTPIVTSCKFLADVSGLTIDFDIPTNRGSSSGVDTNTVIYQTAAEIFIDPSETLGVGALVTWLNPQQMIVSFGENPTCTSSTFLQIQPFKIASSVNHHAYVSGQFLPDVIPDSQKPPTTAVISVPEKVSYCLDWTISGLGSNGGGGRPLGYAWDVQVFNRSDGIVDKEWTRTLRSKIRRISLPEINVRHNATWNISSVELSTCKVCRAGVVCPDDLKARLGGAVDACCQCDLFPGYRYSWRLVTYSWLWGPSGACGIKPVPDSLWSDPENLTTCPATSFGSGKQNGCDVPNAVPTGRSCPWSWVKMYVDNTTAPSLAIQSPSFLSVQPGHQLTLTAKFAPNTCAPNSMGLSVAQLVGMFSIRWRLFRILDGSPSFDACSTLSGRYSEIEFPDNTSFPTLIINPTYLSAGSEYGISVESLANPVISPASSACSSIQILVAPEELSVRVSMGVYMNSTSTQVNGQVFGPENHGVDIGDFRITDALRQTQVAGFSAIILNRNSDPSKKYTYTWNCRHWVLDTYQPWVLLSSAKAAPDPHIVVPCNCTPTTALGSYDGPCPKLWTGQSQGPWDSGSQVMVSERAFIPYFNNTFEYSVFVQEVGLNNTVTRSTTAFNYATFYHQLGMDQQRQGMMDRRVDIELEQISTSSVPVLSRAVAGQPLLLSGTTIGESPNSFSTNCILGKACHYFWSVLSENLNLSDPIISRFSPLQYISNSQRAILYINAGSVPADRMFMIRLYAIYDGAGGGLGYVTNFKDALITVSSIADNGVITVQPTCGTALLQRFTLRAIGWTAGQDDLPLQYSFASRRAACEINFIAISQYVYVQEASFLPSFCLLGSGKCMGTTSSMCSLTDFQLTVRTQFYSLQTAYTSANIWRTEWSESAAVTQAAVTCSGILPPQSRESYMNSTLQQAKYMLFVYKDVESLSTSLINAANVMNLESMPDSEKFNYMNFILQEVVGNFASADVLPDSPEGIAMVTSSLIELFSFPSGRKFVCQSSAQSQILISEVLAAIGRKIASENIGVSQDVLQSLVTILDIVLRCRTSASSSSSRRLGTAQNDAWQQINDNLVTDLCQAQLGNSYGGEKVPVLSASLFTLQSMRKPSAVVSIQMDILDEGNARCGPIRLESSGEGVVNWQQSVVDVCTQVYFYNPVDYPNVRSLSLKSDGADHRQYGVGWPVSDNMCPVMARFQIQNSSIEVSPKIQILFDLSNSPLIARNWFVPKSPDLHSLQQSWASNPQQYNIYAFNDISFAGSCQQWAEPQDQLSPPVWAYDFINEHTQIYDNASRIINAPDIFVTDDVDFCQKMHIPLDPDPTTLAVKVTCIFSPNANNYQLPATYVLRPLYAVVTERADCQGVPDTLQDLISTSDFDLGQLEYARNLSIPMKSQDRHSRQICDRCARCGGFNDKCTLACDGDKNSQRTLDQCGVCGGSCLAPFCPAAQCAKGYLIFTAGAGSTITRMTFGLNLACSSSGPTDCQVIRSLASCPGGCPREVMQQSYPVDTSALTVFEGTTYTFDPGNLTLKSASSTAVFNMHICALNQACTLYILEGLNAGKTPTCPQLYAEQPSCATQCQKETDLWDPNIFCAGGSMTLASPSSACKMINMQGNSSTYIQCSGTATSITSAISRLKYSPPVRYTSGKPVLNNLAMRFTFDEFDPMVYRKDIKITVLPVNNAPSIQGGTSFHLQEDRPSLLNASTSGQPLSIAIYDDAEFQSGSIINVQISLSMIGMVNKSFESSLSIGGSRWPPTCPGCSSATLIIDLSGCLCARGDSDTLDNPWYLASQSIILVGPPKLVNITLQSLEFQTGPNMNENSPTLTDGGVSNVILNVFTADNGYADQRRASMYLGSAPNLTASAIVKIDYVDENDPPVVYMPGESVLFQTEYSTIVGSHIVDGDWNEYYSPTVPDSAPSYLISISATHGKISVSYSQSNCTIQYPTFISVRRQQLKTSSPPYLTQKSDAHVEERDPLVSCVGKNTYGLLVDGTVSCPDNPNLGCTRIAYMQFDLSSTAGSPWEDLTGRSSPWSDILYYDGSSVTLRIYRIGCTRTLCNASATQDVPAQYCDLQSCSTQGKISVKAISCDDSSWLSSGLTFQSLSLLEYALPPVLLGTAFANISGGSEQWLEIPLNTTKIRSFRQNMQVLQDRLCLILEGDPKQNETSVFYGGQASQTSKFYQSRTGNQFGQFPAAPNPELALVRGRSWNCTGTKCDADCSGLSGSNIYSEPCLSSSTQAQGFVTSTCTVQVRNGTGILDQSITFQTGIDPANMILNVINFSIDSLYSNIFHQNNISNVTITVQDVTARYPAISSGGWAVDGEDLAYVSQATTNIKIVTIKTGPLSLRMSPLYSETWLSTKLYNGELPTYVLLEDCGNRPVEDCENCDADCPTKLQIIPGTGEGAEAAFAQMAVEITTKLGYVTIPKSIRPFLTFQKGTGYRDSTVRFYGQASAIRAAALALVYHTKQDESVEYKNDLVGKCSRPCFLNDISPAKFLNAKEPVGCQQGCSTEIYNRVNNFAETMADEPSGTYLDSIFITFEDKGSTGIGLLNYIQVFMYTIYTLAVNDNPCIVFGSSEISVGCRQNCANVQWSSVCSPVYAANMDVISDAGFPFDVTPPQGAGIRNYREDDTIAVKIGALLIKPIDLYEGSSAECKNLLLSELSQRGEAGFVLPSWVSDCPQIAVHIKATRGEVSLNNREFLNILTGASRFSNEFYFIGHPLDCNVALRMVSYRMSSQFVHFNSQLGNETLILDISDQGFSGSDPSGQTADAPAISSITITINIAPVDNLPTIVIPRITDNVLVDEGTDVQLYQTAISEGLTPFAINDPDSDECGICSTLVGVQPNSQKSICNGDWQTGVLTITLQVQNGRLKIETIPTGNNTAVEQKDSNLMNFWANPNCSLQACQSLKSSAVCQANRDCAWDGKVCSCTSIVAGKMCSTLKFTAPSSVVNTAIRAVRYSPVQYYNDLISAEGFEIISTDKYLPENATDTQFFCGDSSDFNTNPLLWLKKGTVNIQVRPINNPPYIAFARPNQAPLIMNAGFEYPTLCEGDMKCQYEDPSGCVAISSSVDNWNITGQGGVSFFGWSGDAPSSEGEQHLFLRSNSLIQYSVAEQYLDHFVLGSRYQLTAMVSARKDLDLGCRLNMSLAEDQGAAPWIPSWPEGLVEDTTTYGTIGVDTWIPCRSWCALSTSIQTAFQGAQGKEFSELTPIVFIAHSSQHILRMKADRDSTQSGDRMVFVDDVQMKLIAKVIAEDQIFYLNNIQVFDPDLTPQFRSFKSTQADSSVVYSVKATAIQGTFVFVQGYCDILQPDVFANDQQRIAFGDTCNVSSWARAGYALYKCPQSCLSCNPPVPWTWVGDRSLSKPCLRLPLTDYELNIVSKAGAKLGSSVLSVEPSKSITVYGDPDYISQVLSTNFFYRPLFNFNTQNKGKETISFETNDKGNFEVPLPGGSVASLTNVTTIDVNIYAVNDAPTLAYTSSLSVFENVTLPLTGISVNDSDVNEVMDSCTDGECNTQDGFVLAKVIGSNGTIGFSPLIGKVVNFSTSIAADYNVQQKGVLATPKVYQCTWRIWCDDVLSVLNQPTRGISYTNPCSTPTLDHTFQECRDVKFPFCIFVRNILSASLSVDYCNSVLTNIENEYSVSIFSDTEVKALKRFQQKIVNIASSATLFWASKGALIFMCTLGGLQNIFDDGYIELIPSVYFNGETGIDIEVDDLGHSGMQYPCPPPSGYTVGFPGDLLWEHCIKSTPVVNQLANIFVPVQVLAVNNLPTLNMYNFNGILQSSLVPLTVVQNSTVNIPPLEVFDPDFGETANGVMNLQLQVLMGGVLDCNLTKTPRLKVSFSFAKNQIIAIGDMDDINTLLRTITYKSAAGFVGVEVLYIAIDDNGNTGAPLHGRGAVQFQIDITVLKPKACQYGTCALCTAATSESCGWCPSSCGGRGKCRQATSRAGPPLYGDCPPSCGGGYCMQWNMCVPPPDQSYLRGAIGAPVLFLAVLTVHFMIMWARQLYGTVPIYALKCFDSMIRGLRQRKLIPPETAKNTQLIFLYIFAIFSVIAPYLFTFFNQVPYMLDLGEVTSLDIESDGCKIYFTRTEQNYNGNAQSVLQAYVTANGTLFGLENVFVLIDSCSDVTTVQVNNSRPVNKYSGYDCRIIITVPQPTLASQLPNVKVTANGELATTIRQDAGLYIDFGPNSFTFSGSIFDIDMNNIKTLFIGGKVGSGSIFLRNSTFDKLVISTDSADVVVSPSNDNYMQSNAKVSMQQSSNSICLISAAPIIVGQVFSVDNPCDRVCSNATSTLANNSEVITVKCGWSCSTPTQAVMIPYTLTRTQGVPSRIVTMSSNSGQLYYTSVPDLRVPPLSGRTALDQLLVYDGLAYDEAARQPLLSSSSLASLKEYFHPGGANRPTQDYFIIELSGASRPGGKFIWVSDVRYLLLDQIVLSVLSIGLLVPSTITLTVSMTPGFCPFFDMEVTSDMIPSPEYITYSGALGGSAGGARRAALSGEAQVLRMNYVKKIYSILLEALGGLSMPSGSTLAYKPSETEPFVLFRTDPFSTTIVTSQVEAWDSLSSVTMVALATVFPFFLVVFAVSWLGITLNRNLAQYRKQSVKKEEKTRKFLASVSSDEPPEPTDGFVDKESLDYRYIMRRTSLFYFVELLVDDPDEQKGTAKKFFITLFQCSVVLAAAAPLLGLSGQIRRAQSEFCGSTSSGCAINILPLLSASLALAFAMLIIGFIELFQYFSDGWVEARDVREEWMAERHLRRLIRWAFYTILAVTVGLSFSYLMAIVTWIVLGTISDLPRFAPYTTAIGLLPVVVFRMYRQRETLRAMLKEKLDEQVRRYVNKQTMSNKSLTMGSDILESIVGKQVDKALWLQGISNSGTILRLAALTVLGAITLIAVLVALAALSNPSTAQAGVVNTLLILLVLSIIDFAANRLSNSAARDGQVERTVRHTVTESRRVLRHLIRQLELGRALVHRMKKRALVMKFAAVDSKEQRVLSAAERKRLLEEAEARDRAVEALRRRRNAAPALQGLDDKALEQLHVASREILYGVPEEDGPEGFNRLPQWHGGATGEPKSADSETSRRSFRSRHRRAAAHTAERADAGVAEVWIEVPDGFDKDSLMDAVRRALPELEGRLEGTILGTFEAETHPWLGEFEGLQDPPSYIQERRTRGGGGGG